MRILVVQESDWIEKGPHTSHHLFERLSKKGHEIRVIDFEINWRLHKKEFLCRRKVFKHQHKAIPDGNIMVVRPSIIKFPVLEYISLIVSHKKEIKKQIEDFKPDVVVGFGILNSTIAIKQARKAGIPFVYYIMDILNKLVPQKIFQPIAKRIEIKNMKTADIIISINEALREYTIKLGASREKTEVVRSGIDLKRYNPNLKSRIREKYGIKKDDLVLFFMGWLYHFSGLKEVAPTLHKNKNIKFLIVGEGDAFEDLKKIKENYKLNNQLILTGKQPFEKIPEFISAADICLLPAYNNEIMRDIVPIKMYEYMAMEKPVISTKLPGIIKEFGKNNGVVYINNPEDALKKALEINKRVEGKKARKFAENCDWSRLVIKFEKVLMATIEKQKKK